MQAVPEIYLGPPGTGKTEKLLSLVEEELAAGTPPRRIGYVSFTRESARVAVTRACEKFKLDKSEFRYFRTIHSMCFQTLGLANGDVLEGKKMVEFGDWLGVDVSEFRFSEDGSNFGFTPADRALFMENLARVRCQPLRKQYDSFHDDLSWDFVERVQKGLETFKQAKHLYDYTDMLIMFVEQDYAPELDVLFVDEAQDLSQLQWRVIWALARNCRRVAIAGDDDQAIYRWAGADVEGFIEMQGDVTVLGQSWRVPRKVQRLATEVIGRVRHRRPKEWRARDDEGVAVRVQKIYDADLSQKDILILGRNNYVLAPVLKMLEREGIIYEYRGHSSVRRPLLEAIVTWEALRKGEACQVADVRRAYEYMSSGSRVKRGYKTLPGFGDEELVQMSDLLHKGGLLTEAIWHEAMDRIEPGERIYLLRARQKGESLVKKPRVRVSSIHGAKGGQGDHVILVRDMAPRTYREMIVNPEDEARVFYVALTRVKDKLTLVAPNSGTYYDV